MNRRILIILGILGVLLVGIVIGSYLRYPGQGKEQAVTDGKEPNPAMTRQNCIADECLVSDTDYPAGALPPAIQDALVRALDDEYKAYATYRTDIEALGSIRPFVMIVRSEQQHINALQALFEKYGMTIPENSYLGNIQRPASIAAACAVGVEDEVTNIALYRDELLPKVVAYEDITAVFTNLMRASEERHLPAFQRCD